MQQVKIHTLFRLTILVALTVSQLSQPVEAGSLDSLIPLFKSHCFRCHSGEEINGDLNLEVVLQEQDSDYNLARIEEIMDAIESGAMPPDGEPEIPVVQRTEATSSLRSHLHKSSRPSALAKVPMSRLNRFQYNNTVKDLFLLSRDVFALSEKLMTRDQRYFVPSGENKVPAQMPDSVRVASHSLKPIEGFSGVKSYPKDLRANHGYDNQANQLTLSPLLLDAFLKLSVSIIESPDFNSETVGIWNEFFAEPEDNEELYPTVERRLRRFLRIAFRGQSNDETLRRYCEYAIAKIGSSGSFTIGMKKVAAAALSSPLFLYRGVSDSAKQQQLGLASRMSYFLWGSCPDEELIETAQEGRLADREVLDQQIDRMLTDPKIERFLDSFPSQWMQLENALAATPNPKLNRYFSLVPQHPAGLQMVLEPLLLFDAIFVENRPIVELLAPSFSYHSDFLKTWYHTELSPPSVDREAILSENADKDALRIHLVQEIGKIRENLDDLLKPVRTRILKLRSEGDSEQDAYDLQPLASWEFDQSLSDAMGHLDLTAHGDVEWKDDAVILRKAYLQTDPITSPLAEKSLEIRFELSDLDQPGGGLMTVQGPGGLFDSIVIGERKNRHWISGSNGFARTDDFPASFEETVIDEPIHLVMVYQKDGTTKLYRNGQPYGAPFKKNGVVFPEGKSSVLFGLRHLPAGGNRFLNVVIHEARLYERALKQEEVTAAYRGEGTFIPQSELVNALAPEQQKHRLHLVEKLTQHQAKLEAVGKNIDLESAEKEAQQAYDNRMRAMIRSRNFQRVPVTDSRFGGIVTNAAMLTMTSGPDRTHPVARGVWITEVVFNDPPKPPPNDIPPLSEDETEKDLTIRERFAEHRSNASCAGCHSKLDPLGFALENFDVTGRWRVKYENGREVDASGNLMRKHEFKDAIDFKEGLVQEHHRFARAFTEHLMRFALARDLTTSDRLAVSDILNGGESNDYRLRHLVKALMKSGPFRDN